MEYLAIGGALVILGYWSGRVATKYPSEAEMFERIVEARVERERDKRRRESLANELNKAVAARVK